MENSSINGSYALTDAVSYVPNCQIEEFFVNSGVNKKIVSIKLVKL
jgi:hypothetical protein